MIVYPNDKASICLVSVPDSYPKRIHAYGLTDNDCIKFTKVEFGGEIPDVIEACRLIEGNSSKITAQDDYRIGDCVVTLHRNRNSIIIPYKGIYIVELGQSASENVSLEIHEQKESLRDFTNSELGIDPCGCPCVETTWSWTGGVRCNPPNIEREFKSNCGNIEWRFYKAIEWTDTGITRCENHIIEKQQSSDCGGLKWIQTQEKCGYSASVLFPVPEDCGKGVMGYMFHPNESRDPAATVEIRDCNDVLYGYIYPTAGDGHTIEISFCDGSIVGYAANRSDSAPNLIDYRNCDCT